MNQRNPLMRMSNPRAYEEVIERLRAKNAGGRLFELAQDGVPLATLAWHSARLARLLCDAVVRGEYEFGPAEERRADIGGKVRSLYRMRPTDTIVAGVVAGTLSRLLGPCLSLRCYSYQKGRSSWEAVADFGAFLREHRRERPMPRERGLYVLRRDISAYGESIPLCDDSPLWPMLDEAFDRAEVPGDHPLRSLAREAVRPLIRTLDGNEARFDVGTPTGSPVQPVINNLYLSPVDRALEVIEGGFYARFGDDFVFAHPDPDTTRRAEQLVDERVAALRLTIKQEKRFNAYFTTPGRPSDRWPEADPASRLEYLGCRIDFRGTVGLKRDKIRRLLRDIRHRVRSTRGLLRDAPPGQLAAVCCAVVARMLDPRDMLAHPLAALLAHVTNDRGQLAQIDHHVALIVAEVVSGRRGPRAFRHLPYRELRRRHGLPSLVHTRNLRGRTRGEDLR